MRDLKYLTDSYDEKIERINRLNAPLNFLFITDMHNRFNEYFTKQKNEVEKYESAVDAIRSIQYILDRCKGISFIVSGGDIGNDYDPDPVKIRQSYKEVQDALYNLSVPVHCCVGNHDDTMGNCIDYGRDTIPRVVLPEEMHELCMKNNPTKENYYYFDFDTAKEKYRFIILNTSDRPYFINPKTGQYEYGWRNEISDKQIAWFKNCSYKTDRKIIVFSHTPLTNKNVMGSTGAPTGVKPFEDLLNSSQIYREVKGNSDVIMSIFGHVHFDNLIYDDSLLRVSTLCSLSQKWCEGCPDRIIGTPTETAFDVYSIDGKTLNITRFGAGFDRQAMLLRA